MSKIKNNSYLLERINKMYLSSGELENKKKHLNEDNERKILSLKDIHKGKRCFIIGGSPSLSELDLTKLNNEYTFCNNRGYLLKEKGLNHSTYYVLADKNLVEKEKLMEDFDYDFCSKFFVAGMLNFPDNLDTVYYNFGFVKERDFTPDLTLMLNEGETIIYHTIQIAYYLGFSEIYLIGVDLDFKNIKGHIHKETQGEIQRQKDISMKTSHIMLKYMDYATDYIEAHNRHIFNASPKGIVDCMPRVKYEELF